MAKKTVKKTAKRAAVPEPVAASNGQRRGRPAKRKNTVKRAAKKVTPGGAGSVEVQAVLKELRSRWAELNIQRLEAERELRKAHDDIMNLPNVTGVHVGLRRSRSKNGGPETWVSPLQFCIRVHVKEKFEKKNDPRIVSLLPEKCGSVAVDVQQRTYTARPTASNAGGASNGGTGGEPAGRVVDPLVGGIPIATTLLQEDHWGTLGKLFFYGEGLCYLTNRHVVGGIGMDVQQPPNGKVPVGKDYVIGKVVEVVDKEDPASNRIDAAIVSVTGTRKRRDRIDKVSTPFFCIGALTEGDKLTRAFKVGGKTGRTEGLIQTVSGSVIFSDRTMVNQIIVEPDPGSQADLCDGGDSGSLLCVEREVDGRKICQIVGLVHAEGSPNGDGTFRAIVACHIKEVMDYFGLRLEA